MYLSPFETRQLIERMKRAIIIFSLAWLLVSCISQKNKKEDEEKPVITVSILPLKTFVEKIAGNDFEINVLLPPGASPAAFSLVPSQLKKITRSAYWLRIGHIGFEYSWKDKIQQVNLKMKVVDLSEGLNLIESEVQPDSEQNSTGGINPHTWLSPTLVKQMAGRITEELSLLNPEKKEVYRKNYSQFAQEINQLDAEIKNALNDFGGREFIMFHPSLAYYAREYNLVQHSLEPGGKEPTPQRMARLVDFAKKENIRVIYIQSDLDLEQARVFAEEIDGEIVQMWPLNPAWAENLQDITKMLVRHFRRQ